MNFKPTNPHLHLLGQPNLTFANPHFIRHIKSPRWAPQPLRQSNPPVSTTIKVAFIFSDRGWRLAAVHEELDNEWRSADVSGRRLKETLVLFNKILLWPSEMLLHKAIQSHRWSSSWGGLDLTTSLHGQVRLTTFSWARPTLLSSQSGVVVVWPHVWVGLSLKLLKIGYGVSLFLSFLSHPPPPPKSHTHTQSPAETTDGVVLLVSHTQTTRCHWPCFIDEAGWWAPALGANTGASTDSWSWVGRGSLPPGFWPQHLFTSPWNNSIVCQCLAMFVRKQSFIWKWRP